MDIKKQLGNRIQELRKTRGISQEKFAEQIDIAVNTMSSIERGNAFMTAATLEKILKVLNINARELFTFEDEQSKADLYKYILLKIKFLKNDTSKLRIVKSFLDSIS